MRNVPCSQWLRVNRINRDHDRDGSLRARGISIFQYPRTVGGKKLESYNITKKREASFIYKYVEFSTLRGWWVKAQWLWLLIINPCLLPVLILQIVGLTAIQAK